MKRKRKTPQEKKLLSYVKDTRNTYGESSRSRFAIAKRKTFHHQALRHEQKLILKKTAKVTDEEIDLIESKVKSVKPKRWRKCADSPLGELISDKVEELNTSETVKNLRSRRILRMAKKRWKPKSRYSRWVGENMNKKTIKDVDIKGKRVFIRVDFNVPIKNGVIEDDTRIRGALPTINYAVEQGAKVVLASHLGRPLKDKQKAEEKGMPYDANKYSLKPVYEYLRQIPEFQAISTRGDEPVFTNEQGTALGKAEVKNDKIFFALDSVGDEVEKRVNQLKEGEVLLLENLRLHAGEEKNDDDYAKKLAELCDVYVNDAFGAAHRAHASTQGIIKFVETAVAGLLMEKELEFLGKALNDPERPFVAILGGAKVSDKIPVIESLIERNVDKLLIGGAMAYTFFKANGYTIGKSLVEDEMMPKALEIEKLAKEKGVEFILPTDHQVVDSYDPLNSRKTIPIDFTNKGLVGLDIGAETSAIFARALEGAKTIVWNGPMGMFEEKPFDEGTIAIANAVAEATINGATSIVGGGDSVSAINQAGLDDKISHISTGGGATLEFLSGDALPGVEALNDK